MASSVNDGLVWPVTHEQGVPEDLQWLLRELFTVVFDGRNCNVMPGVEAALGRPATDFKSYVQKTVYSNP